MTDLKTPSFKFDFIDPFEVESVYGGDTHNLHKSGSLELFTDLTFKHQVNWGVFLSAQKWRMVTYFTQCENMKLMKSV